MKVHLVRSKDMTISKFNTICDYINDFKGDINFQFNWEEAPEDEQEKYEANPDLIKHTLEDNTPRNIEEFEYFFELCNEYRNTNTISENELVILLTNQRNDSNYFGYCSQDIKNVFIQCSNWGDILGEMLNDFLPIVYEIAAWTLRFLLFKSERQMIGFIPPIKTGCVMDMCVDKKDISFKIRTGDIRPEVMALISQRNINPAYINQLISIFEKIRNGVLFRQRVPITNQLTRLKLVEVGKKLKFRLVDFGDVILNLEPLENIIYSIFLLEEDGIRLQFIEKHIQSIDRVFRGFYISKPDDYIVNQLEKYSSKDNNRLITQNITRINEKLQLAIPASIYDQYVIQKGKGDKFKISLDRNYVDLTAL